ncbi:RDD family protein [Treponema denticola]|uniref:RDD family protein n=1 Tax=Treponema denticola TaxID=158 RepID=UPI003D6E44EA
MESKRIGAFLIDFIITAMIMNIPFWILVIYPTIKGQQPSDVILRTLISTLIAFLYLILRDLPSKGSIGKRILKLKIINSETKKLATSKQRFLRNITWLLNWIEIIAYIITKKRIGDRIAKTEVVEL